MQISQFEINSSNVKMLMDLYGINNHFSRDTGQNSCNCLRKHGEIGGV